MQIKDLSKELNVRNRELIDFLTDNGYDVTSHLQTANDEMIALARDRFQETEIIKEISEESIKPKTPRVYNQHDLILCRSVTPGWLGMSGKSGQYYVFTNIGDEQEIEYQDLFALKSSNSRYLYDPLIIIEDEELLENNRWKDLALFYDEKVYGLDNINEILNIPINKFKAALENLPKGLAKALTVEVAKRIEDGTFDSLRKINIIDDVCGTDFKHIISFDD